MKALADSIRNGEFCNVYLLFGEETYLRNQYKTKLLKALIDPDDPMNLLKLEGKNVDTVRVSSFLETMPFFAERRVVFLEDTGFFQNSAGENLIQEIKEIPETSVLLFVESEVDKRNRLYKAVKEKGRVTEFVPQTEKTLESWILGLIKKENKRITKGALQLFLEMNGTNMELLSNELEKLFCFTMNKSGITEEDVILMGTPLLENRVFEMVRAIGEKKQKKALDLYYDLLSLKEPPLRILALIGRQFQQLRAVADFRSQGFDRDSIATKMKLQSFIVKNLLIQSSNFTLDSLKEALHDCVDLEEAVKTGRMTDRLAVELLIVKYSTKEEAKEN